MSVEESVRKKLHASKEKIDKHNLQKSEGDEIIETKYSSLWF